MSDRKFIKRGRELLDLNGSWRDPEEILTELIDEGYEVTPRRAVSLYVAFMVAEKRGEVVSRPRGDRPLVMALIEPYVPLVVVENPREYMFSSKRIKLRCPKEIEPAPYFEEIAATA